MCAMLLPARTHTNVGLTQRQRIAAPRSHAPRDMRFPRGGCAVAATPANAPAPAAAADAAECLPPPRIGTDDAATSAPGDRSARAW